VTEVSKELGSSKARTDSPSGLPPAKKYDHNNPRPLPEDMPLLDLGAVDMAFSTANGHLHSGGRYLSYYEGQCDLVPAEWQKRANTLFFKGGGLDGLGLKIKTGLDRAKVQANLHHLLSSWGPKHEEKAATVGFALMKWCEPK